MYTKFVLFTTFRGEEKKIFEADSQKECEMYLESNWDFNEDDIKELLRVGSVQIYSGILTFTRPESN